MNSCDNCVNGCNKHNCSGCGDVDDIPLRRGALFRFDVGSFASLGRLGLNTVSVLGLNLTDNRLLGNQVMMLTASARRFSSSIRKRALTKKSTLTLFTPRRKSCATLKFIRMLILKRYHRFTSIPISVRRMRHRAKSPIS